MKLNKLYIFVILFFLLFIITGCRDKEYESVVKAPASFQKVISEGLTDDLEIKNCYTVPSKNYPGSYFVAGEIYGGNMGGDVAGVWILDNYDTPGNILSVNQSAIAFSTFKAAKYDKPKASITNVKDARILKKYVERKYYKK